MKLWCTMTTGTQENPLLLKIYNDIWQGNKRKYPKNETENKDSGNKDLTKDDRNYATRQTDQPKYGRGI